MDVHNGFIVGIFNYCDRWCERCQLTNRCQLFADLAEMDFEHANGALTEPKVDRQRRKLSRELGVITRLADACHDVTPFVDADERVGHLPAGLEASFSPDPEVIAGGPELRRVFTGLRQSPDPAIRLAMETIEHFALLVPMKMIRAMSQVAGEGPGGQQSDANGSGKAARLGLERMAASWQTLIASGEVSRASAAPFLAEIARLQRNLDRALPHAQLFVRPGFDEPEAVAALEARERAGSRERLRP